MKCTSHSLNFPSRGFTLIEVVLAIALSAGLLAGVLEFYQQVSTVRAKLDERVAAFSAARLLMQHMTLELQAVTPTTRGGPLVGRSDMLEFTTTSPLPRSAWAEESVERETAVRPGTDLKRVVYQLRGPWRPHQGARRPAGMESGGRDGNATGDEDQDQRRQEKEGEHEEHNAHAYGVEWKQERFPQRLTGRVGRGSTENSTISQGRTRARDRVGVNLERGAAGDGDAGRGVGGNLEGGRDPTGRSRQRGSSSGDRGLSTRGDLRPGGPRSREELDEPGGRELPREVGLARRTTGAKGNARRTFGEPQAGFQSGGNQLGNHDDWRYRRGLRITDRIRFLRFRYYDGRAWRDDWNAAELPRGIEIQLGERELPQHLFPAEYPYPLFRRIVHLPAAGDFGLPFLREGLGGFDDAP